MSIALFFLIIATILGKNTKRQKFSFSRRHFNRLNSMLIALTFHTKLCNVTIENYTIVFSWK